ncbi:hypothetical protein Taro_023843 [Colocasia esculenta]|uniref:Uncharacterized protein n=1 Tax=Colocasia esculenta TaxID=4460 RepID=A0A843V9I9_COLES|nr:hypothetical protein [Colocasia esculenta]
MKNWSSSVDTSSSSVDTMLQKQGKMINSVDTRDRFQKTIWKTWDSVSTLDEVVSTLDQLPRTFWVKLGQSTLAQAVSTLEGFPEHSLGCFGTVCRH